jgi:hypothetical protein
MRTFDDILDEVGDEFDGLNEGVLKTGAIGLAGNKSRQAGIRAERAYNQARTKLKSGSKDETLEDKLDRVQEVMDDILVGLIAARYQLGHSTALNVAGHLIGARNNKR